MNPGRQRTLDAPAGLRWTYRTAFRTPLFLPCFGTKKPRPSIVPLWRRFNSSACRTPFDAWPTASRFTNRNSPSSASSPAISGRWPTCAACRLRRPPICAPPTRRAAGGPAEDTLRLHTSSGTTGKPKALFFSRQDVDNAAELCARSFVMTGVTKKDVFQNMMTYGLFTGALVTHYGAEKMVAARARRAGQLGTTGDADAGFPDDVYPSDAQLCAVPG